MRLPTGAWPLTDARLAVLIAVAVQRRPTFTSVAAYAGLPYGTARSQLKTLRRLGLVSWTPGARGTLCPRFRLELLPGIVPGQPTTRENA